MIVQGHIKDNMVVPDKQLSLPDGAVVSIVVPAESRSSGLCGIWHDTRPVEQIVADILASRTPGRAHAHEISA